MQKIIAFFLVFVSVFVNIFPVSAQTDIMKTTDENGCRIGLEIFEDGKCEDPYSPQSLYDWAKKHKLTTTKNLKDFNLNANITREEAAAIVVRTFDSGVFKGVLNQSDTAIIAFVDQKKIAPEFVKAAKFVQEKWIMRGDNGYFRPKSNITNYETLVVASRAKYPTESFQFHDTFARDHLLHKDMLNQVTTRQLFFYYIREMSDERIARLSDALWELRKEFNMGLRMDISPEKMPDFIQGNWSLVGYTFNWNKPERIPADFYFNISPKRAEYRICYDYYADISLSPGVLSLDSLDYAPYDESQIYCRGLWAEMHKYFDLSEVQFYGMVDGKNDFLYVQHLLQDNDVVYIFKRK